MSLVERIFSDDSEMAARMRIFNWSAHELGEPASWSSTLRTAVAMCLASPAPTFLMWGPSHSLLYNDAAVRLLGSSHPEALGARAPDVWRDRWSAFAQDVERVRTGGGTAAIGEFQLAPIYDDAADVGGIVCTGVGDERRRAEVVQLANLTSELRTPLTLILGPLYELLARSDDPILAPREELELIHRGAVRMHKLLGTLFTLSRLEAGTAFATFEPASLDELTRNVVSTFRSTIEGAGLSLHVDSEPIDEPVYVDPDLWERIVIDLVANAFKFTFEGEIRIELRRDGDGVVLAVRDTGVGIPEADLPHVFERFYRSTQQRAREDSGAGIGLALVRELVALHGGTVTVASTPGSGSQFTVRLRLGFEHLPAAQLAHEPRSRVRGSGDVSDTLDAAGLWMPPAAETTPDPGSDPSRATILVADDSTDMREYLAHVLGDEWNIVEARDGLDALHKATESPPDLVLADVMMPELDGVGLVRALRGNPRTSSVPAILVTARSGDSARNAGLEAGADDYLLKPFTTRELRARVRTQLELSRARRAGSISGARDKDDFLALIGHELRNPLSTVSTMIQALMLRAPSREIELMERSVRHLTRLVEDLLESSRLSRGKISLQPKVVEVAQVVDRAMELVSPLFEDNRNKVLVQVPRVGCRIEADAERLARAISNVLTNAAQYSPPGTRISVDVERDGERVALRITDEGQGIAAEQLGGVFETFKAERSSGGLGLGLAIARSIVELHGGTIIVASEGPGQGTRCTLELPATNQQATEPVPPPRTRRKRLLLVEDNDDAARALKSALEQLGYEVALAHDAPIALNLAKSFHPDVALLDLGLPVMDGWELARRLRGAAAELPIVAVTARDQEADKQRSAELGFADHLVKPIDLTRLEHIVESLPALPGR